MAFLAGLLQIETLTSITNRATHSAGINARERKSVKGTAEPRFADMAGAATSQSLRRGELVRLIKQAGREPVERDTLYRPVERSENVFTVLV